MSRVLLLFGGRSAEHEVSCVSAVAIHDALVDAGHRVIPVGIDRDGAPWESFVSDPAAVRESALVTEIYYPISTD